MLGRIDEVFFDLGTGTGRGGALLILLGFYITWISCLTLVFAFPTDLVLVALLFDGIYFRD